jgi:hypothetical protein
MDGKLQRQLIAALSGRAFARLLEHRNASDVREETQSHEQAIKRPT